METITELRHAIFLATTQTIKISFAAKFNKGYRLHAHFDASQQNITAACISLSPSETIENIEIRESSDKVLCCYSDVHKRKYHTRTAARFYISHELIGDGWEPMTSSVAESVPQIELFFTLSKVICERNLLWISPEQKWVTHIAP